LQIIAIDKGCLSLVGVLFVC